MIFFKNTIIGTMVITLATAWSGQFPQFYHTFPSPTPPPIAFRPFFQEPMMPQRYFVHQPQFRQPLVLYQPPTPPQSVQMRPNMQSSRVLQPTSLPQQVTTTGVHHHVFYYYFYLPAKVETPITGQRGEDGSRVAQRPCGDHHPVTTAECPPVYLPPTPSPTTPTTQTPTTSVPPPSSSPCNDDAVVVDNVDYYPFGRTPIVVPPANGVRDGPVNESRDSSEQKHRQITQPNFILANYLLPPDK